MFFGASDSERNQRSLRRFPLHEQIGNFMIWQAIKSPEPTAVGAFCSAVAVHVASRRWLRFFR
jgi:hypothetical protein